MHQQPYQPTAEDLREAIACTHRNVFAEGQVISVTVEHNSPAYFVVTLDKEFLGAHPKTEHNPAILLERTLKSLLAQKGITHYVLPPTKNEFEYSKEGSWI